jgi:ribosomal protein S18 acetylase RimI-like enzyme
VADVLDEAAAWLRSRGIQQWPARFSRGRIAEQVRERDVYVAWDRGQAVGTFSLQVSDPEFWGDRPSDALYLHGLAVRRSHAGLGPELLARAERLTVAAGRRYLRLDCGAANLPLRAYYERAGFEHRGDRRMERSIAQWTASLYEKVV